MSDPSKPPREQESSGMLDGAEHVILPVVLWALALGIEPAAIPVALLATVLHGMAFRQIRSGDQNGT